MTGFDPILNERLTTLPGVSAKRAAVLEKLGLRSWNDLLRFYPRAYEDWSLRKPINEWEAGQEACFVATVLRQPALFRRGRFSSLSTVLGDERTNIKAVWFNQPYLKDRLQKGSHFLFRGKIKAGRYGLEIQNPSFQDINMPSMVQELTSVEAGPAQGPGMNTDEFMKGIYPLKAGLTQNLMRRWIAVLLERLEGRFPEVLPGEVRRAQKLCDAGFACNEIHRPRNPRTLALARHRLAFEELFLLQCALARLRSQQRDNRTAPAIPLTRESLPAYRALVESLPFQLTKAQKRVLNEIAADMSRNRAMNRLIQGDVGSGKTIIAALAMYQASLAGGQSVLMAPTAILAKQHEKSLRQALEPARCKIALLTGQSRTAERREILSGLQSGEIDILVGTHAVLEEDVCFRQLALAVTDEQHRFGVKQRLRLSADDLMRPHVLVMSATPIPRSLALVLYGDLDISILDERPPGRMPIQTRRISSQQAPQTRDFFRQKLREGRQAYVIYPAIRDSEAMPDLLSLQAGYEDFVREFEPEFRVGMIHGELPEAEKQAIMTRFYEGEVDILLSTTVVEVGVDQPNACLMWICNAERFGLAQLHQLRGRIGRGTERSYCFLETDSEDELSLERLDTLCETDDGFAIAEADLRLRGPGEFFGTRQHGLPELRLANLYEDWELLQSSHEAVNAILEDDPEFEQPAHRDLREYLDSLYGPRLMDPGI